MTDARMRVAILYIGIGEYQRFWSGFRRSAEAHLVPDAERTFVVFSDRPAAMFPGADLVLPQDDLGWPFNTLERFRMFARLRTEAARFDRMIFCNANCEVMSTITTPEVFGADADLVACRHPGFFDAPERKFTYERRPASTACVAHGTVYVAGGLMGGRATAFLEACDTMRANIATDLDRGLLALWHDESHWNAYINKEAPARGRSVHLLDPGFLSPEGWRLPFPRRILLRDKARVIDVARIKGPAR